MAFCEFFMSESVAIIGAGPVGLTLAVALMRQGIACEVFEALPELSTEARASTFHPRTLEMLAEWQVLEPLLARGYKVHRMQYWERRSRELIAQFEYSSIAADTPYPFRLQCPQSVLTRVLLPLVQASPLVKVHMKHQLTELQDQGDCIDATFETERGPRVHRSRLLCGTDGSRSVVRHQLGITFDGMTYEDRFLLVGCDINFTPYFGDFGPVCYLFDPSEWVIVLQLPDVTRVVFRLRDDEDEIAVQQPEALRARLSAFVGQPVQVTMKGTSIYKVHQRVAESFVKGSAIILGDAAHINNPMGGMGMNSGIHDAHALAPRLAEALRGGSADFSEWAAKRREFALNDVRGTTDKNYRDMAASDATYRQTRDQRMRAIAADPQLMREHLLKASMLA